MSVIKQEYTENRITKHDLLPLSFLKKSAYTGSRDLLRYRIEKKEEEEGEGDGKKLQKFLLVTTWTTPFCFDKTADEDKSTKQFPFSEEGLNEIVDYLENIRKSVTEK